MEHSRGTLVCMIQFILFQLIVIIIACLNKHVTRKQPCRNRDFMCTGEEKRNKQKRVLKPEP